MLHFPLEKSTDDRRAPLACPIRLDATAAVLSVAAAAVVIVWSLWRLR